MPPARNGPDEPPQANDPLRRLVHELEARTRADAARLAELSTLLEHSHVLARRQRLQYEVAGILAQSTTIDDAIPRVLRAIGEIKQWDIVIGWVLEDGTWVQRYEWSVFDPDALSFLAESRACRFESGQGLPDLAIREDKVVWIDDFSAQAGLPRARTAAGLPFNNALVFPLRCGHTHYGAIELIRRASAELQAGTRDLFESLRSDIGRFIEVRLYETRLREEHARLRRAQRIARLAHWHWNPRTEHLHIDAHSDEILGLNQTDLPTTAAEYLAMVPRDDQDRLIAAFESARSPGEATLEIEHALRHANGEKHIVIVRAEALFDPLGKLLKAHGTIQDITERRREESRTRAVEKRWEAIFRNSPLPAFITDAEIATCLAANEEMLEWLGLPEEAVVGRSSTSSASGRASACATTSHRGRSIMAICATTRSLPRARAGRATC
jgi:PAS domain S-box-containing protein